MKPPERVIVVDWSASTKPSPQTPSADAIWLAIQDGNGTVLQYHRTRTSAVCEIRKHIECAVKAGVGLLVGFDFPLAYPAGFAEALSGEAGSPFGVWNWLSEKITDTQNRRTPCNNRFEVAAEANKKLHSAGYCQPFWGRPDSMAIPDVPTRQPVPSKFQESPFKERRLVEGLVPKAQTCWKLYTTGSVGSQALLGIPRLNGLRKEFSEHLCVWPFERADKQIVLAEVYPSLIAPSVEEFQSKFPPYIKDAVQVGLLARALQRIVQDGNLDRLLGGFECQDGDEGTCGLQVREEGWFLGVARSNSGAKDREKADLSLLREAANASLGSRF